MVKSNPDIYQHTVRKELLRIGETTYGWYWVVRDMRGRRVYIVQARHERSWRMAFQWAFERSANLSHQPKRWWQW